MGAVGSKSPLERRNTVARRSQRRTLHNLKPRIDTVYKEIKKFKGQTEAAEHFQIIKNEIEYLKNDLIRRGKDLQPQVRALYENVYKRVMDADDALQQKLQENIEKQNKKEEKQNKNNGIESPREGSVLGGRISRLFSDVTSDVDDNETVVDIHHEDEVHDELKELENSKEKRKTVELKFVKVIEGVDEDSPKPVKEVRIISPEQKRKSILKVGVPVMPGAIINAMATNSSSLARSTRQYDRESTPASFTEPDPLNRIKDIVESLRKIEEEINDFVGRRNGKQYNRLRDNLNKYLLELNQIYSTDDVTLDQLKVSKNYVGSCLSFLDERATDDARSVSSIGDDDVFDNNNLPAMQKIEDNLRLQRILKNTAV